MAHSPQHLDRLRLRHLRLLELINTHGSLRAVGSVLNLTQPAVSQMVKDLEFAFGAALVDRSVRGVALSAAGELALQRARSGLATFEQLAIELGTNHEMTLRVGTNSALMFNIIPAALRRLNVRQSGQAIRLQTGLVGDMMQALADGKLDCYVGRIDWDQVPENLANALSNDPIASTDLVLVCSEEHPMARRKKPAVQDLAEYSWALPTKDSNNRIALETSVKNAGISHLTATVEVAGDPNALIALALELNLLTCVPRLALDAHNASCALCVLDIPDLHLPKIHIGFATLSGNVEIGPLQVFRQALNDVASTLG